jgi:hypothetical protein
MTSGAARRDSPAPEDRGARAMTHAPHAPHAPPIADDGSRQPWQNRQVMFHGFGAPNERVIVERAEVPRPGHGIARPMTEAKVPEVAADGDGPRRTG